MTIVIITSLTEKSGKTMLSAGLVTDWQNNGKKIAYLKLRDTAQSATETEDRDVLFLQKILTGENSAALSQESTPEEVAKLLDSSRDVTIIEVPVYDAAVKLSDKLKARLVVVHDYAAELSSNVLQYHNAVIAGVVINKVPAGKAEQYKETAAAELSKTGIELLGVIPESRILSAMSVMDLAEALQGQILNNEEKADELIENLMMGSSTFDRGAAYYGRKENKAVLLWGERPGFRKAALANLLQGALQTSTRCIVISASGTPIPAVATKAGELAVPLISAPGTMLELTAKLERAAGHQKFVQQKKLPYLTEILQKSLKTASLIA